MTRKERLTATLKGQPVDRPAVSFYELDGYNQDETNPDPFNIFNHPSWQPLLDLIREKTEQIVLCNIPFVHPPSDLDRRTRTTCWYDEKGSRHEETEIQLESCVLHSHTRRDMDIDTVWVLEHLIKDQTELEAWLTLPEEDPGIPDCRMALEAERALGDAGIIMIETGDAVCALASLLGMENFMIFAMTEQELFERALDRLQRELAVKTRRIADRLPGRLWRIYGPEYACAPYLPPALYLKYVTEYDKVLVDIIHSTNGFARLHQHGRQKDILPYTLKTGCDGIDPIEPIPHGDISLLDVRKDYGKDLVLFGNLEIRDIEQLSPEEFEPLVEKAIEEGTFGEGKGFVLMPSACPLGRVLPENTFNNYKKIIEVIERL